MKNRRVKAYVIGRGYVDIAKSILGHFLNVSPVHALAKTALAKAAEVTGHKIGAYVGNKMADKVIPVTRPIHAIEELEKKIKRDIETRVGSGFKLIK